MSPAQGAHTRPAAQVAQAITYSEFGGPEVLVFAEVEPAAPGPGQVRVRVRAASVNPIDLKIRRGEMGNSFASRFPLIPGLDVAGEVDLVGSGVSDLAAGDGVFGVAVGGAYAEYALLGEREPKPPALSWELAASLPTAGEAAFRALAHLELQAGETLLIVGAGGSVGWIATQLALRRGVRVVGAVAVRDEARLHTAGASAVRYGAGLAQRVRNLDGVERVDAVLDVAGRGALPDAIELAGGSGARVITLADSDAARYGVRFTGMDAEDRAWQALPELAQLAARGELDVPIAATYPLAQARVAHEDIEARRRAGKHVLIP